VVWEPSPRLDRRVRDIARTEHRAYPRRIRDSRPAPPVRENNTFSVSRRAEESRDAPSAVNARAQDAPSHPSVIHTAGTTDHAMANMFGAVDFGFRPIRPEDESLTSGPAISTATAMDCGFSPQGDVRPEPVDSADWLETDALSDDDLFISDNETLPDATGFGARQRELNEAQAAKLAAEVTPALRSPFRGSTLRELCERFGDSCPTSATPCNVWCEVLETLRERERTKQRWRLDPNTARHMKYRTTLIEWILEVCADFGFGPTTADLAVQYMVSFFADPGPTPFPFYASHVECDDPFVPSTPPIAWKPTKLTIHAPPLTTGSRAEQG